MVDCGLSMRDNQVKLYCTVDYGLRPLRSRVQERTSLGSTEIDMRHIHVELAEKQLNSPLKKDTLTTASSRANNGVEN